jgi:cytochrome P450/NADPH-cytochrome P450 reductase
MTEKIPGPTGLPFIGNLLDLQDEVPLHALERLADIYGPIFKLKIKGTDRVFVSGFELFDELCDETRFFKSPPPALQRGDGRPQGLFSATSEKTDDWTQAHRILMPAFGPLAIEEMFDGMWNLLSIIVEQIMLTK